ncbi:iron chelate uptake ABC transporter family permease subunit [Corynebacterium bovis]|uniref:iron chelate uptake ABC transporter family permease subunit n=1 Tax=Corynebacterium bovis TaxID=36808 RepID=UPI00244B605F|nr:iron chelate uptake ABC transporter family permease subunit [Corynebacterium bovis]MDH2456166.1 iron chelate uptake ABC transporter family permease subunit [Corynebacterium bovis]
MDDRHRRTAPRAAAARRAAVTVGLVVLAVGLTVTLLSYGNPLPFGSDGYLVIARLRATALVTMAVVALCQGFATVAFQTVADNRIITPSIMGFEALYATIQTSVVFLLGVSGLSLLDGAVPFAAQTVIMVAAAAVLYGTLLTGRRADMQVMLLVGVVVGGGLRSLSAFMQRLMNPADFDILTARLFGNIGNADARLLPTVVPVVAVVCGLLLLGSRRLDVLSLGRDTATNLGLDHRRATMLVLLLVSVLMAVTTALVGPMTFVGFLAATLAHQLCDTYAHRWLLPVSALVAYCALAASYLIMRHVFAAEGAVTVVVEFIGGSLFLFLVIRKGRL